MQKSWNCAHCPQATVLSPFPVRRNHGLCSLLPTEVCWYLGPTPQYWRPNSHRCKKHCCCLKCSCIWMFTLDLTPSVKNILFEIERPPLIWRPFGCHEPPLDARSRPTVTPSPLFLQCSVVCNQCYKITIKWARLCLSPCVAFTIQGTRADGRDNIISCPLEMKEIIVICAVTMNK